MIKKEDLVKGKAYLFHIGGVHLPMKGVAAGHTKEREFVGLKDVAGIKFFEVYNIEHQRKHLIAEDAVSLIEVV